MGERTRRVVFGSAALIGLGCGGGDVTTPTSGTIVVTTNTSGPEPDADGYAVTIDDGAETAIPASGTIQRADVEPGNHSIRLTGIAANCIVAGENPRSLSLPVRELLMVTFELTCTATTGGIQITSNTTGPSPDADGYNITLDGTDRGVLPTSGATALDGLAPGSHSIGLSGVAGNCQVQGDNPRPITVEAGASATLTFEVVCAAPSPLTGSLRITTSTNGPDPDPDGYSFAIDDGATQSIGVNATSTLSNVAAGSHNVRLSGLATNCQPGGTNPRVVTISAGATAEVSFAITCTATTGSVEITTTTQGAKPDPDGYIVSVDNGKMQTIGTGATVAVLALTPGSHTVALAGIASNCRVDGENPRAVILTAGQKATTIFALLCPTSATYRPTDLGTLGGRSSSARDINAAGQVVGVSAFEEEQTGPAQVHAFIWQDGVMVDFTPGDNESDSYAQAINSAGQVVGGGSITPVGGGSHDFAWLWVQGVLTHLRGEAQANDINAAGQVVGVYETGSIVSGDALGGHAGLWVNGSLTDLGTLGGVESQAHGIDPAGRVVGQSDRTSGSPHAFLWENGIMTDLNIPGDASIAHRINAAGQVVGTVLRSGVIHGFLWEKGATIDLGEVLGVADINSAGQVVGTRVVKGTRHAFVWEKGVVTDLPGPSAAHGINDGGQLVGHTWRNDEEEEATLWTPE